MSEEKKLLSAAEILSAEDIVTRDVQVDEWGGTVRLRSLAGDEVVKFVQELSDDPAQKNNSAVQIVLLSAVDESGARLFTVDQLEALRKKSFRAILRLQKVALEINGLSEAETAATKND